MPRKKTQKELLILGCGHAINCGRAHSESNAWTIDYDRLAEPDSIHNISNGIPIELIGKKFTAIILEHLPNTLHNTAVDYFKELLKVNGIIIINGIDLRDVGFLQHYNVMIDKQSRFMILHQDSDAAVQELLQNNKALSQYFSISNNFLKNPFATDSPTISFRAFPTHQNKSFYRVPDQLFRSQNSWDYLISLAADFGQRSALNREFGNSVKIINYLNELL